MQEKYTEIIQFLQKIEQEHKVKILYACESGSRAWGFASKNSDFDVRFCYTHTTDWYLSFDVERKRDVIEYEIFDDIDCNGWDIKKVCSLFMKTNASLMEWLNSPIIYKEEGNFTNNLRQFSKTAINQTTLMYHYSNIARSHADKFLFKEKINIKKYFYVLRALLAVLYIQKFNTPPPVEFEKLLAQVAPKNILKPVQELLIVKKSGTEQLEQEPVQEINDFIQTEIANQATYIKNAQTLDKAQKKAMRQQLNIFFQDAINGK